MGKQVLNRVCMYQSPPKTEAEKTALEATMQAYRALLLAAAKCRAAKKDTARVNEALDLAEESIGYVISAIKGHL